MPVPFWMHSEICGLLVYKGTYFAMHVHKSGIQNTCVAVCVCKVGAQVTLQHQRFSEIVGVCLCTGKVA